MGDKTEWIKGNCRMGSFCIGNVGDIGGIGMVGMRGAGCGMREGVPLMRHNFYMGNVHRLGEMPGWVERSGPPKFGGLRAAVGGCTIVQGTYKADWQKVHGTNEEISKQEGSPHSLPEVRAAPKGRRGCTVVRVENEIKVTCIPGELPRSG